MMNNWKEFNKEQDYKVSTYNHTPTDIHSFFFTEILDLNFN